MTNPFDYVNALVATLQNIPDFASAFGGASNVVAYHSTPYTQGTLVQAIKEMGIKCYVMWLKTEDARDYPYKHRFALIMRANVDGDAITNVLMNGIPVGSATKLRFMTLIDTMEIIKEFGCQRRLGVQGEPDYIDAMFSVYDSSF